MASPSTTDRRRVDWNEALAHATDRVYLRLFGLIAIGWLLWQSGTALLAMGFAPRTPDGGAILLGLALAVAGAGAAFVGVVASAYKLLVEVRVATDGTGGS